MRQGKKLLFELSGEHPELPFAELNAVLGVILNKSMSETLHPSRLSNRLAVIDLGKYSKEFINKLARRLSMCRTITELLGRGTPDSMGAILEKLERNPLPRNSTFKVRTRHLTKRNIWSPETLNMLRSKIIQRYSKHSRVQVKHPDFEIVIYIGPEIFVTRKIIDIQRSAFESRKPQYRPFFAPISLHPRLARCLVNLAELSDDEVLLDPFCGTGGLLLEAGLIGISVIGSDFDPRMAEGTKENLTHWGIKNFTILNDDVATLSEHFSSSVSVHGQTLPVPQAIVTEPPYGRASTIQGEDLDILLRKAFKVFSEILGPNGRLVITLPDPKLMDYTYENFELLNHFTVRVHKSLTKNILVLKLKS